MKAREKIENAFIELLKIKEFKDIKVTEIIKLAKVNRSTFYTNFIDIYDLKEKIKESMYNNLLNLYKEESISETHSYNYLKLFKHIKNNQEYYNIMFKLDFDFMEYYNTKIEQKEALKYLGTTKNIDYHIEFFKKGISGIIKLWLKNGCYETPEEINEIILTEYKNRIN